MSDKEVYSVLLTDDDPNNLRLLYLTLNRQNFLIMQASNAFEAMDILKHVIPDAIMMDYQMAGLNGLDSIKLIRTTNQQSAIIVMTAYSSDEVKEEAIISQADHFLGKPIEFKTVPDILREKIKKRRDEYKLTANLQEITLENVNEMISLLILKDNKIVASNGIWKAKSTLDTDDETILFSDNFQAGLIKAVLNLRSSTQGGEETLDFSLGTQHLYLSFDENNLIAMLIPTAYFFRTDQAGKTQDLLIQLKKIRADISENKKIGDNLDITIFQSYIDDIENKINQFME